jgi:hypothetical protein
MVDTNAESPLVVPRRRWIAAVAGGVVLAGVGALALFAGSNNWGTIYACRSCGQVNKPLAKGWIEVPPDDSWAISLESGMGVVVRGPARFEVAGPRPHHWALALSRGVLFGQVATDAHAIVLLQRSTAPAVEGATVSNDEPHSRFDIDSRQGGNIVRAGAGKALLQLAAGPKTLATNEIWQSGPEASSAAPTPTDEEQHWLDELAPPTAPK